MTILDPIGKIFFSRVSRSVPFFKKKDPRRGGGPMSDTMGYALCGPPPLVHFEIFYSMELR